MKAPRLVSLALVLWAISTSASAVPIITVDMDPGTAGIQNTLTVAPGAVFSVDIVIFDDGSAPTPTIFDTVILDLFFTTADGVLGFGPTGPVAGTLSAAGGLASFDAFSLAALSPGFSLATDGAPAPAGTVGVGAVGYFDPTTYLVAGAATFTILSMDFVALPAAGSSTIDTAGVFGGPALALAGAPLGPGPTDPTIHVPGIVNVIIIPEPGTVALLGAVLAGLAIRSWQRRRG